MRPTYRLNSNAAHWQVAWTDAAGRRHRRSLGRKADLTRREAEARVQQLAVEHGITPGRRDSERERLGAVLDRYLLVRESELDPATLKAHRRTADLLREFFVGNPRLDDLHHTLATDWRRWLATDRGLGESTVCKHCRIAKVIARHAISERLAAINPFEHLVGTAPRSEVWSRRMIELDEILAIETACPLAGRLVSIGWFAGLRTSEAVHLQWSHVERDRLHVVPRGGRRTTKQRRRIVRIEPGLSARLEGWARTTVTVAGVLEAGKRHSLHRVIESACRRAGVEPFTMQDLRRTRDTIWHETVPAHVACAWIGHSEQVARDHYLAVPEQYYTIPAISITGAA